MYLNILQRHLSFRYGGAEPGDRTMVREGFIFLFLCYLSRFFSNLKGQCATFYGPLNGDRCLDTRNSILQELNKDCILSYGGNKSSTLPTTILDYTTRTDTEKVT